MKPVTRSEVVGITVAGTIGTLLMGLVIVSGIAAVSGAAYSQQDIISKPLLVDIDRSLWACSALDNSGGWPAKSAIPLPSAGIKEACKDLERALFDDADTLIAFQIAQRELIERTAKRLAERKGDR